MAITMNGIFAAGPVTAGPTAASTYTVSAAEVAGFTDASDDSGNSGSGGCGGSSGSSSCGAAVATGASGSDSNTSLTLPLESK